MSNLLKYLELSSKELKEAAKLLAKKKRNINGYNQKN